MTELGRQLMGVTAVEPPATDTPAAPAPLDDTALEALGTEPTDLQSADRPERPIENVRAEFARKFGNLQSELAEIKDLLRSQSSVAAPKEPAGPSADNDLDRMPVAKLQELRGTLQPEQQVQLDAYLTQRIARDAVRHEMAAVQQTQSFENLRKQAGMQAAGRYPEILDPTSEFAQRVQAKLVSLGKDYAERNPRAALDVANEVAIEIGYAPKSRIQPGVATRQNQGPVQRQQQPVVNPRLASRLADAMPGRKFDEKRLAEGLRYYAQQGEEQ